MKKYILFLLVIVLTGCQNSDNSGQGPSNEVFEWKLVTAWPPNLPVFGEAMIELARELETISNGRLKVTVYGGGELVPPLEIFDAVSNGVAQMGHSTSYYWSGKAPASVFFSAVPFGLDAQQMNTWLYEGGGLELWEELYANHGLVPFPCGNTGVQMGGWFNREINSIKDFQGLKMRIPGLGGSVISKAGGSAVTVAGGEVYTNLERGVIDATEWIGPFHDYKMGFHKIAKYYYYPGWHEPGATTELFVNKAAFEGLPEDLQLLIETTAHKYNQVILAQLERQNAIYLQKLKDEGVVIKRFPDEVLVSLKSLSEQVIAEQCKSDPFSAKVYKSMQDFKSSAANWNQVAIEAISPYLK